MFVKYELRYADCHFDWKCVLRVDKDKINLNKITSKWRLIFRDDVVHNINPLEKFLQYLGEELFELHAYHDMTETDIRKHFASEDSMFPAFTEENGIILESISLQIIVLSPHDILVHRWETKECVKY